MEVPLYTPEEATHIIDSATGKEYEKILRQSEKDLVIRSHIEVPQKADSIIHAQDSLAHHIRLPRQ